MLGTLQHVLILQKKRRGRQSHQAPLSDQPKNSVSRTQLGAKSGDHHRGIENDPSHVTSYRMSHCIGYFNLDGRTARKMLSGFWMKATAFLRPPLALQPTDVQ